MSDKNHEHYLEQIESAVAETTKELMETTDYDKRGLYKRIAEQQVEIDRLREYQSNDKTTIKKLRKQVEELNMFESELAQQRLDEIIELEHKIKELESEKPYEELYELQHENDKLKEQLKGE